MKILSWNCIGLGKSPAVRALRKLILTHQPDIVFLTEKKFQSSNFLLRKNSLGNNLSNHFFVDCTMSHSNRSGGLAMLWSNNIILTIVGYNNNMIDCYIESNEDSFSWRATGIYGFPQHDNKALTCDLLSNLHNTNYNDKWLLFGDFNLIFNNDEKYGGRDSNYNIINMTQETLRNCNLEDLGYHGESFTWSNNQADDNHIKERLDRFCATPNWISKFPRFTNYHLLRYTSDHSPILLVFGTNNDFRDDSHSKSKLKRFENIWIQDPECLQIIKATWEEEEGDIHKKLSSVINNIHKWGRMTHGNIPIEIKNTQNKIQSLRANNNNRDTLKQIRQFEIKLDGLLQKEEHWWSQRAKVNWLLHGDKNSKEEQYKLHY
jgi:exonuclease III